MRLAFLRSVLFASLAACSSSGQSTTSPDAGADGLAGDGGAFQPPPATEACTGAMSACLWGTAAPRGFKAMPMRMEVNLYKVFPSAGAKPVATMPVALDGTWAFSNVAAWAHYYVQLAADYGQPTAVASLTGPLQVPASGPAAVAVEPVQLLVLEQSATGTYQVDWAEAQVFDPDTGAQITQTANVAITVAGATTPMPWGAGPGGTMAYFVQFPTATLPAAQPTYTITTSAPAFGPTAATWQLTAAPPTFTGTITSPTSSVSIPHAQPLTVTWPAQPAADYVVVELFEQVMGQWSPVYESPLADGPDTTSETIPAADIPAAGTYLLNVDFSTASCPPAADGCVLSSTAADAQLTAQ